MSILTPRCRPVNARCSALQETPMDVLERIKADSRRPPHRAVHEGHAAISHVRIFQPHGAGAEGGRRHVLHTVNVLEDPEMRANLPRYSNWPTFPQLFINGELIGGCDITLELYESGELARMLTEAQTGVSAWLATTATPAPTCARHGRVVLVAGAHGGLGVPRRLACARAGATVVLLGRRVPKLNRLYDAIAAEGGEALLYPLDLEGASPTTMRNSPARIEAELGRLDGLLHCAAEFSGPDPAGRIPTRPTSRAPCMSDSPRRWWLTQACLPLLARSAAMPPWSSRSTTWRAPARPTGAAMAWPSTAWPP